MIRRTASLACLAASLCLPPVAGAQGLDMGSLWPNDDGHSWTYAQHYESYYPSSTVVDNTMRLFFDGTLVVPNGIATQYLREQMVAGTAAIATADFPVRDRLLQTLWLARPDLHGRLLEAAPPCPFEVPQGSYALFLTGEMAYRKSAEEIAAWRCSVADTRSWLWLVSDLTLGNTFTLQLVPDLASDVFLHGTIAAIEDVTTAAGTYPGCLRVDYWVDYGTSTCTSPEGNVSGTSRAETRGSVYFAPGVGPVQSHEEFIPFVVLTGQCYPPWEVGRASTLVTMNLSSAPVPVRPMTWGRLKTIYR